MNRTSTLSILCRRFDRSALPQLQHEVSRLASEIESLRDQLSTAEANADFWSREATNLHLHLCELQAGRPGLTVDGHLVVVTP